MNLLRTKTRLIAGLMCLFVLLLAPHDATLFAQSNFNCNNVTEIPTNECQALVAFYNSTGGNNWESYAKVGWLQTNTPCSWSGISCGTNTVRSIRFPDYVGVTGTIPSEIGDLPNLENLTLIGGNITSIPPEIGTLPLDTLWLDGIQLTNVPSELWNVSSLRSLNLDNNSLTTIPPQIDNLTNLFYLSIHDNQLTTLPPEIGNLFNLERLWMQNNRFGSIPSQIGNLSKLQTLALQRNNLTTIPSSIGNLTNLEDLLLNGNQLTSIPSGVSNMLDMKSLYLHDNQITTLPDMSNLTKMQKLYLGGNPLSDFPNEIWTFTELEELWLYRTQMTDMPSSIGNLVHLQDLNVGGNELTNIPSTIGNLSSLHTLNVSGNQLTSLPSEVGNLSSLTLLAVNDQPLVDWPTTLSNLTNLDSLYLRNLCEPATANLQTWIDTVSNVYDRSGVLCSNVSIAGRLWIERNGTSGYQTSVDEPLGGINVHITGSIAGTPTTMVATTNSSGYYRMNNLPFTQYTIVPDTTTLLNNTDINLESDPNGLLDGESTVSLTLSNPSRLTQSFVYADPPTPTPTPTNTPTRTPLPPPPTDTPTPTNTPVPVGNIGGFLTHVVGNDPVPGATIWLRNASGSLIDQTETDSNGIYLFTNVVVGTGYQVSVDPSTITRPDGADADPYDKDPLTLTSEGGIRVLNGQTTNVNVTVDEPTHTPTPTDTPPPSPTPTGTPIPCGDITGYATHLDGDPIPNVVMVLRNASGNLVETVETQDDGVYTFECVDVGTEYSISIDVTTLTIPDDDDPDPYDKDPFTLAPITGIAVTNNQVTVVDAVTVTDPTYTPTPTPTPTFTPTPITPTPNPDGDEFEMDDSCASASDIPTTGLSQNHTFHDAGDVDWIRFETVEGETYQLIAEVPYGSSANVVAEVHANCDVVTYVDQPLSNYVLLNIRARHTGYYWVSLFNDDLDLFGADVAYRVSVSQVRESDQGAVIIVAGRDQANDPLQSNIHDVTDRVYEMFYDEGYAHSQIHYIATDAHPNDNPNIQVDYDATVANFQTAVLNSILNFDQTNEAESLTIYMMSHGFDDGFYLDDVNDQRVSPEQLNQWLDAVQMGRPNLEINVIIDACYAGSFVNDSNETIAGTNRVIIGSSPHNSVAWSSFGSSNFSDFFLLGLNQRRSIKEAFLVAQAAVSSGEVQQLAWINDNGVQLSTKDAVEGAGDLLAADRYLRDIDMPIDIVSPLGILGAEPIIDPDSLTVEVVNGVVDIQLSVNADPDGAGIGMVEAILYPPSVDVDNPPTSAEESPIYPTIQLTDSDGDGTYQGELSLGETGTYQVVIRAQGITTEDVDGVVLEARPVTQTFTNDTPSPSVPLAVVQTTSQTSYPSVWLGVLVIVVVLCSGMAYMCKNGRNRY